MAQLTEKQAQLPRRGPRPSARRRPARARAREAQAGDRLAL